MKVVLFGKIIQYFESIMACIYIFSAYVLILLLKIYSYNQYCLLCFDENIFDIHLHSVKVNLIRWFVNEIIINFVE
jgi:ABC-type Mn2+/Zn2+ transport system permease subunit